MLRIVPLWTFLEQDIQELSTDACHHIDLNGPHDYKCVGNDFAKTQEIVLQINNLENEERKTYRDSQLSQ